ncbi:MAG: hypothetical protein AAB289_09510 [Chloroflexota bacterium]
MERTTIMAPAELLDRLRRIAHSRHISLASLMREALEEKAAKERRRPTIAGIAASRLGNLGERAGAEPIEPPACR